MKKQFFIRLCFMLSFFLLFAWARDAKAADTVSGTIQIENRNDTQNSFSCDVKLSGDKVSGRLYAVLFAESEQVKGVYDYPAASSVNVALSGVATTDYIKILWTDEQRMPMANPVVLKRSQNNAASYEAFMAKLQEFSENISEDIMGASGDGKPIIRRLLVSCDELPDLSEYKGKVETLSAPDNLHILQFTDSEQASKCQKYLKGCPSVRYVEPDSVVDVSGREDPQPLSPPYSWGVEKTGIGEYAKRLSQKGGNHPVVVAVVDSGADLKHPFLKDRLTQGYDFVEFDNEPEDQNGHGSHVTGTIVDCTPGMDNISVMPVRVLNAFAAGTVMNIANGIRYAASHGANVINLSLGCVKRSQTIEDAVNDAISRNITVVVAAGNKNGNAEFFYPANMEDCITVAAVDKNLERYELSNYGDCVDIAAPGVDVWSSVRKGEFDKMSGTSMAAPHVSAAAALLISEHGDGQTPFQISNTLQSQAADLPKAGKDLGAGFLNMRPAVREGVYAILYADGEMVFQNSDATDPKREAVKAYPVATSGDGGGQYAAWYEHRDNIRKVTFAEAFRPISTALWFYGCSNLSEVQGIKNLDTSGISDMSQMFARCASLKTLDLSGLDTGNVKNMNSMFSGCGALTELDLTGWDAKNVADMRDMFKDCSSLETVYASESFSGGERKPFDFATRITSDMTLYADWEKGRSDVTGKYLVVSSAQADPDGVIPITIDKRGAVGLSVLQFDVVFPDELILTEKPIVGTLFADKGLHRDVFTSPYTVSLGDDLARENVTAEGTLVTLYFKLRPDAPAGEYAITITGQDNYDADVNDVTFDIVAGKVTAAAGGSPSYAGGNLTVGSGTVATGDTDAVIPITIEKKGDVGLTVLQFDVVFPDELELTAKPTVGTLFEDKGLHRDVFTSPYTISLGDDIATENVTDEGVLVTLNFKVKAGTPAGDYAITIDAQDNYNADVDSVTFAAIPGKITVTDADVSACVVTFETDGGSAIAPAYVKPGETVAKPADPRREGYVFKGWVTYQTNQGLSSAGMFKGCGRIVGGNGTTFSDARTDAAYAHVDGGASNPGYFSGK